MKTAQSGVYGVVKHAVVALSETLYRELELGCYDIGVSVLCPWIVKSNILESERNRPIALRNKPGEGLDTSDPKVQTSMQFLRQLHKNGMSPEQVADIVFKSIKEKKFYILPDAVKFKSMIQTWMEDILQKRNPTTVTLKLE